MTNSFDDFVMNLILEADSWISGFIFPDNTLIYSKSNRDHHADLIDKHWSLFSHYFDENEFSMEDVQNALLVGKLFLFKNRKICPFIIDRTGVHFDLPPTDEQRKYVERKRSTIVMRYGAAQGV